MKYLVDKEKWDTSRILYKFGKADSIFSILNNLTIKATRPDEFNDPFDTLTLIDFDFDLNDLPNALLKEAENLIFGEIEPVFVKNDCTTKAILELHKKKQTLKRENIIPLMNQLFGPLIQALKNMIKKDDEDWRSFLLTWRIVCLSEDRNNILLWSHYADKHSGGAIGFKCVPQIDSAFCAAIKVNYCPNKPTLGNLNEWIKHITNQKIIDFDERYMDMVFTKSADWEYEKEWRYPLKAQNLNKTSDYRSFDQGELGEVVLGCRMSQEDEDRICNLCREKYPNVKILKAVQSKANFELEFTELH